MSQLTTNTATIDELITMANNLPDAGSGGGSGGNVETCTVTVNAGYGSVWYTEHSNGTTTPQNKTISGSTVTLNNVMCDITICLYSTIWGGQVTTTGNIEMLNFHVIGDGSRIYAFSANDSSGGSINIAASGGYE